MIETFEIVDVVAANQKHDREHGNPFRYDESRIKSAWNAAKMIRRGKLTDKQIAKYAEMGFYSAEFRDARRKVREAKQRKRDGNFNIENGRMIYSPR